MSWAGEELSSAELGDTRRVLRLMRMVESMAEHAERSLPQSFGGEAEVKAAYRFFENDRIAWREILRPHSAATARRARQQPVVLVAQDTTEINLSSHPATQGLGYLASADCRGVLLHTCFALSAHGVPLGVVDQQMWVRPLEELGKRHQRHAKTIEDKESRRWLDGLSATQEALPESPQVVVMGDRESDIYALFAAPRRPGVDLLVRARHEKRSVEHPERYLAQALQAGPAQGQIQVSVPRSRQSPPRAAILNVRWATLGIRAPQAKPAPSIALQFLLAEEVGPSVGEEPIRWLLATTLPIGTLDDAARYLQWYVYRWRIERFHFTLKSGLGVEDQQFEHVDHVRRALATCSIVAWRVLWLMLTARENPELPCSIVLHTDEWQALYASTRRRGEPAQPPGPPTMGDAARRIGRLGGYLGRKGDPGVKTIWRGLARLHDITTGWRMAHAPPLLL